MDSPGAGHNPDKIVPTQKGLTVSASLLPALHEAIDMAMQEARDLGLL